MTKNIKKLLHLLIFKWTGWWNFYLFPKSTIWGTLWLIILTFIKSWAIQKIPEDWKHDSVMPRVQGAKWDEQNTTEEEDLLDR